MANERSTEETGKYVSFVSKIQSGTTSLNVDTDKIDTSLPEAAVAVYWEKKLVHDSAVDEMRRCFAWFSYLLVVVWLGIVLFIVIWNGVKTVPTSIVGSAFSCFVGLILGCKIGIIWHSFEYKSKCAMRKPQVSEVVPVSMLGSVICGVLGYFLFRGRSVTLELSEPAIIALITTTTASVIGILGFVMWWLFPRNTQ